MNVIPNHKKMTQQANRKKWWQYPKFPIIPIVSHIPETHERVGNWEAIWLFFRLQTVVTCDLRLSFVVSHFYGVGLSGELPYLRWSACIPIPLKWGNWIQQNLWRKSQAEKEET